jgi:hypothetical protein
MGPPKPPKRPPRKTDSPRSAQFAVKLVAAKAYLERNPKTSIRALASMFDVHRTTLTSFLAGKAQKVGRPLLFSAADHKKADLFLLSCESGQLNLTVEEARKRTQYPGANRSFKRVLKRIGFKARKARGADKGRVEATKDVEKFSTYLDMYGSVLSSLSHNPDLLFNVDEVGVQFCDRSLQLVTKKNSLNKVMDNTKIHSTVTLCTSPGGGGRMMAPHFLFQSAYKDQRNFLPGTNDVSSDENETGYQDPTTWMNWLALFILYKNKLLLELGCICFVFQNVLCFCLTKYLSGYQQNQTVLLTLDGHYSHLDLDSIFMAAKHNILILCLPSHATHILQPNDKAFNRKFKLLLDKCFGEYVGNGQVVDDYDIAWLCEKALADADLRPSIPSSFKSAGAYPFDQHVVLESLRRFEVEAKKKTDREMVAEITKLLAEKLDDTTKEKEEKERRKKNSQTIQFGTARSRVLTSSSSMARLQLKEDFLAVKSLKKNALIAKMVELGFVEADLRKKGVKVDKLKEMVKDYFEKREAELVGLYNAELEGVMTGVPASIHQFFIPDNNRTNATAAEEQDQSADATPATSVPLLSGDIEMDFPGDLPTFEDGGRTKFQVDYLPTLD